MPENLKKIGKYEVESTLGQGAMGTVYKAQDLGIGRTVAIKVISRHLLSDPAFSERLKGEARSAGRLSHPNVLTIYELGEDGGIPFIVMEYLPGRDLRDIIRDQEPLPLARKVDIAAQIARGLQYAHECHVTHRDVKPGNIRVLDDGRVKIMDFGVAKLASGPELTRPGTIVGTAQYLSPELIRGQPVDHRTDIFSYGAVLYEILCYQKPFAGDSFETIAYKIVHEAPAPLLSDGVTEIPPDLSAIVRECLEKDVRDRFAELGTVVRRLEAVRDELHADSLGSELSNLVAQGDGLVAEERFGEAAQVFQQAAALSPGVADIESRLAHARKQDATSRGVEEGNRLADEGRHEEAIARYRQVLDVYPDATVAKLSIERVHQMLVDEQRKRSHSERIDKLLKAGRGLLEVKQLQQALDCCEQILAIDPEHEEALALREECRAVEERLDQVSRLISEARQQLEAQAFDTATRTLEQVKKIDPENLEASDLKRQVDRWREANRIFKRAEEALGLGDWKGARTRLQEVTGLEPNFPGISEQMARVETEMSLGERVRSIQGMVRAGRMAEAKEAVDALLEQAPKHRAAQELSARIERRLSGDPGTMTTSDTMIPTASGSDLRTLTDFETPTQFGTSGGQAGTQITPPTPPPPAPPRGKDKTRVPKGKDKTRVPRGKDKTLVPKAPSAPVGGDDQTIVAPVAAVPPGGDDKTIIAPAASVPTPEPTAPRAEPTPEPAPRQEVTVASRPSRAKARKAAAAGDAKGGGGKWIVGAVVAVGVAVAGFFVVQQLSSDSPGSTQTSGDQQVAVSPAGDGAATDPGTLVIPGDAEASPGDETTIADATIEEPAAPVDTGPSPAQIEADEARTAAIAAKEAARAVDATRLASDQYDNALSSEQQGEKAVANGTFQVATAHFKAAELSYNSAAQSARRGKALEDERQTLAAERKRDADERQRQREADARREAAKPPAQPPAPKVDTKLVERATGLQSEVAGAGVGVDDSYLNAAEARAAEVAAAAALASGDHTLAVQQFEIALTLFNDARAHRKTQEQEVSELLKRYAAAFEQDNIDALARVAIMSNDDRQRWGQFFGLASEIKATVEPSAVSYDPAGARMVLKVKLDYVDPNRRRTMNEFSRPMQALERNGTWMLVKR